jgi:cobalt-zinc-cadmium efflux system outer membrane protein
MEAKAKLALAHENLRSLQGIVTLNERRVSAGATAPVELTRSRVAMLQFRNSVKTAELGLATARIRLQALLGRRPPAGVVDISGEMRVSLPPRGPELANLQTIALEQRPDMRLARLDQARNQADLRLQIAQGKVDYTFGAEYRRQQGINGKGNMLGFFFSAPIPVFNRNQGEIARARAEQEQLGKSLEALRSQIFAEVASAFEEYESTRTLLAGIEQDLLAPSEEARNTTAYVYRAGASSLIDVLDAQRAFNETMSAYYGAQADYRRASSKLTSAVGQEVIP